MITIPFILTITIVTAIILIKRLRPGFRYFWLVAIGGSVSIIISLLGWIFYLPMKYSPAISTESSLQLFSSNWIADNTTLPIIISLSALALAALLTSVVRNVSDPYDWASILLYTSLGILAIMSDNLFAITISWVCIDIIETITLLRYCRVERSNDIVVGLSVKLVGLLLTIWSAIICISSGLSITLQEIPTRVGGILIAAIILRIWVLPLVPPVNESNLSKNIFSISRPIAAISGLILLIHMPVDFFQTSMIPFTIILLGIFSIIFSIPWLFSKNEIYGRPYWILSFGLLIMINSISGNFNNGKSLLEAMVLLGGMASMYLVQNKKNIWIPIIGLWGLSSLPYSLTYGNFLESTTNSIFAFLPAIAGYSILIAGYIRHLTSRRSNSDISQQPKWIQFMYQSGLVLILAIIIILGLYRGFNNEQLVFHWIQLLPMGLALIIYLLHERFKVPFKMIRTQSLSIKNNPLTTIIWGLYNLIRRIIASINFILEGDGGMLWSLVFLLLFITILTQTK